MFNKVVYSKLSIIISAVMLTACSGGINKDLREANNSFSYLDKVPTRKVYAQPSGTDTLKFSEKYTLPEDVILDNRAALLGKHVDIRPPQKIIVLDSNVQAFKNGDLAQIWFYPAEDGSPMTSGGLVKLLLGFLSSKHIDVDDLDPSTSSITTSWTETTDYGGNYTVDAMDKGILMYRQRYMFKMVQRDDGTPGVEIQLIDSIIEEADGTEVNAGLTRFEPSRFTSLMANKLLSTYHEVLEQKLYPHLDNVVEIELARDNNGLPCWMVSASFEETYKVLEQLFLRYDIKIVTYSSSGGEIKINYSELDEEEWKKFGTESWAIDSDKYIFKIGVYKGKTTITVYDDLNKALETNVVARMYSGFAISLANEFEKYRSGDIIINK